MPGDGLEIASMSSLDNNVLQTLCPVMIGSTFWVSNYIPAITGSSETESRDLADHCNLCNLKQKGCTRSFW